jgi:hypothetical protein
MTKGTAYALRERALSEAGALDKCRWEPGTGLTPDKKEANGDRGTGSDAPPRRSPRLMEDLICNRAASQGNSSPANSSARAKAFSPLGSDSEVIVDSEMPKINCKFGKPPSCWNSTHACPRPERDFRLAPFPRISVTAIECGRDEGSALKSGPSESEHVGMRSITRSKTDSLCRKVTGPVWRRCANSTSGVMASPRLGDPGVVPRKNGGCEYAHHLETV